MKVSFRKDLQIASVRSESDWNQFKVNTLLQNVKQKQPSINAYLGARYSRSSDSVVKIASEVIDNNTDAAERLEKIFSGYGHKSVGDMADLFICIEDIPIYTAMKIFYLASVISGQERSTRYQDFQSPKFVKIPKELCSDNDVRKGYERIIFKQMKDYREMMKPSKNMMKEYFDLNITNKQEKSVLQARTFDIVRYLLPYGLQTSAAYLISARSWSEMISFLCASDSVVENEVAELLLELLSGEDTKDGYVKEANGLIRHTDPNCCRKNSTGEVLEYLKDIVSDKQKKEIPEYEYEAFDVSYSPDVMEELLGHYEDLINPLGSAEEFKFSDEELEDLGEMILEHHDHHNLMGNLGQMGSIKMSGYASLGSLKDLNRHRSFERFMPLFHEEIDMDKELERKSDQYYYLCNYLYIPEFSKLRKDYESRLKETYKMIKDWRKKAKNCMSKSVCDEYTKYLLPHAHATKYTMYGSVDDFQYVANLRIRNGGHIAYRVLVYEWLRKLSVQDPFWKTLLRKKIAPKADSREQLLDRS